MEGVFRHDAAVYRDEREYLDLVLPVLRAGLAARAPTVLRAPPEHVALVGSVLGQPAGLTLLDPLDGQHPFAALHGDREAFTAWLDGGAARVHVVSEVPAGTDTWDTWAPFEAAANHVHADQAAWKLCPYDGRSTAQNVLDDAARTHPYLCTVGGERLSSPQYCDPAAFLADRARHIRDPLETDPPAVDLMDPAPAQVRTVLGELDAPHDLVYAASEVTTNAHQHGTAPVRVQAWVGPDRIAVTVHDAGRGPADPYAGLMPVTRRALHAGMGLWMAHRLCDRVTLDAAGPGFTVRLVSRR